MIFNKGLDKRYIYLQTAMASFKVRILILLLLSFYVSSAPESFRRVYSPKNHRENNTINNIISIQGGGLIPAGYNPFGYQLTDLGEAFLKYEGSLESDIGRFLATFRSLERKRKTRKVLKEQWLEILRMSKTGQSLRIYRKIDELLEFCVEAGFLS